MEASLICLDKVKMKIAVISVTKSGDVISGKLKHKLDINLYSKTTIKDFSIKQIAKKVMEEYEAVIFISSTGIAVRAIAEHIKSKDKDPAVLVIDSCGNFVISLLSGHLGGANELALTIAQMINSTPVITTATDNMGITAPDMIAKNNGLLIDNLKDAKNIAALLVDGKKVGFIDDKSNISIPKGYTNNLEESEGIVYVTNKLYNHISNCNQNNLYNKNKEIFTLKLVRKDIVLGIGCRKDFNSDDMRQTVQSLLKDRNIDKRSVKFIGTVEVKKDEQAILKLAEYLGCELKIFSIEEINKVHNKYEGSNFVEKTIGVRAVCEPCVELTGAKLITEKIKANGMTVCIGELDI
ncbi:cobalamin biosynthesis protein CbiG [Clostridium magnum DSM 2767]|uniref:Cobalamin biosynthesis protein CbiG n=2 Tax=Clostridium magnum TaxID=33954 RepID=A0A162S5Y3_9CLOT|nr:cobalamin biosynthesis protein CbiG [Clostridium magnum DSM 2767]SHI11845.1 cobalt-precorrin 5A acetaldehyde-lyase [Clostridium magnum DSM 2767]